MQEKIKQIYVYKLKKYPKTDFSLYYPFEIDQLEAWEAILDWKAVSANQEIEWSPDLIKQFSDKWDWLSLWMNKSVLCWDAELLEEYIDGRLWQTILWSSIDWSLELHERFKSYLPYDYDMIKKATYNNRECFLKGNNINFSKPFTELYSYANSIDDKYGILILL